jgi:hypothetical protein
MEGPEIIYVHTTFLKPSPIGNVSWSVSYVLSFSCVVKIIRICFYSK